MINTHTRYVKKYVSEGEETPTSTTKEKTKQKKKKKTLINSNFPCLEHIFTVPKVFEPLSLAVYVYVYVKSRNIH